MMRRLILALCAVMAIAVVASPVQARPRDDVMSLAFRCAAIGDSRIWLDCYYGAAQPARAALGMPPAPAGQVRLTSSPPAGNPVAAELLARDAVMQGALRCIGQGDERQWLNCYYAAAQSMRVRLGLVAGPQQAPALLAPVMPMTAAPSPPQNFGRKPVVQDAHVDHVIAQMQAYSFDKLGWFTVTLDNGQVWRQVHGDTLFATSWKKSPSSYRVRISRGFFNSYNLQVIGLPGLYKVLRDE